MILLTIMIIAILGGLIRAYTRNKKRPQPTTPKRDYKGRYAKEDAVWLTHTPKRDIEFVQVADNKYVRIEA